MPRLLTLVLVSFGFLFQQGPPVLAQVVDTKALQQALLDRGFDPGPVDGVVGDKTQTALEAFETANGLDGAEYGGLPSLIALGLVTPELFGGQVEDVMTTFAADVAQITLTAYRQQAGVGIMTTETHPLRITFDPPKENGWSGELRFAAPLKVAFQGKDLKPVIVGNGEEETVVQFAQISLARGPDTRSRINPIRLQPGPDGLDQGACDAERSTGGASIVECFAAGGLYFGGVLARDSIEVSCFRGRLVLKDNNQVVGFEGDANCAINLNPVYLRDGAWMFGTP